MTGSLLETGFVSGRAPVLTAKVSNIAAVDARTGMEVLRALGRKIITLAATAKIADGALVFFWMVPQTRSYSIGPSAALCGLVIDIYFL